MSGEQLFQASNAGEVDRVKHLLQSVTKADIEFRGGVFNRTPLIGAAEGGHSAVVRLLLDQGAQVNAGDDWELTALHQACENGHAGCVSLLLQHPGAEVNLQDRNRLTALHWACVRGGAACVSLLLQHPSADVNLQTKSGNTPLHKACEYGQTSVLPILLQHEAKINIKNKTGKLPLDVINEYSSMTDTKKGKNRELLITMITATTGNHVYVKTTTQTHLLQVNPTDTVREIKKMLHTRGDIPAEEQMLFFAGKVLEDDHTIGYYAPNKAVLDMIPQSDDSKWQWTDDEKKTLSEMSAMCVLFMGEKNAGKSSLVNTILQGRSYTTHRDDRTVVADISHWVPPGKEKTIFTFVDCGGHRSYRTTAQYFHRNSTNNVGVLCHDVSQDALEDSFAWLKTLIASSPKCHILVVLTKTDTVTDAESMMKKKEYFMKQFVEYIEKEKEQLFIFRKSAEKANHWKQKQFDELEKKYSSLNTNLGNIIVVTSCKEGYIESIEPLIEALIKLAEDADNMILLPEDMQLLYLQIGKQGAKPPNVNSSGTNTKIKEVTADTKPESATLAFNKTDRSDLGKQGPEQADVDSGLGKQGPGLANVDSDPGHGDTLAVAIADDIEDERPNILPDFVSEPYLKFYDIIPKYEKILEKLSLATVDIEGRLKYSLRCLHSHSLLMFFRGGEELEKVVFHDMSTVMSIFRSVFHHKVSEFLEMKTGNPVRHKRLLFDHFNSNEHEFKEDIKLSKQGLLSKSLVGYLLAVNGCNIDVEVVVQLLEILETGFSFIPDKLSKYFILIPFYIQDEEIDPDRKAKVDNTRMFKKDTLSIQCRLSGTLPITYWNYLVVRLLKHLSITTQTRHIWAQGFWAAVGKNNTNILLLYNGPEQIDFFIKASITDVEGHATIWKYLNIVNEECDRLERDWWPGLISSKTIVCTHCRLMNATPESEYDLDHILREDPKDTYCCEHVDDIPAALLHPLSKEYCGSLITGHWNTPPSEVLAAEGELSDLFLLEVSKTIGSEWQTLASYLGVNRARLDQIKEDNITTLNRIHTMLMAWRNRSSEPNVVFLMDAIRKSRAKLPQDDKQVDTISRQSELSDLFLLEVSKTIGSEWQTLASYLGVNRARLDQIKEDNITTLNRIHQLLMEWRNRSSEPNVVFLMDAIRKSRAKLPQDDKQVDTISRQNAEKKLKEAQCYINARVDQQNMENTNDGSLKQLVRHEVQREVKHEVRREVGNRIAPYEDYAFRLPQIRNHHQHLVENLYVLDVLDHLVPVFSVDDYEAIKALEKTPRNQTRMFLYVLDKRGRTALDVLISAIREDLHLAHLTHLLVHLED